MSYEQDLIHSLNDLIEKNYDAKKGFENASENIFDQNLKEFFASCARQRFQFIQGLNREIIRLGGYPEGLRLNEEVHMTWMDIRSALANYNENKVLKECIRGEMAALDEYREIAETRSLPLTTRNLIEIQMAAIQERINSLKLLVKQYAMAS